MVDQMENRVYVQMEKDAQTSLDRQFLFVCQLADAKDEKEKGDLAAIRRHPINPTTELGYGLPPETERQLPFLMHNGLEPVKGVTRNGATIAMSEGGGGRIPDEYPTVPKLVPSTTPRNPFLPAPPPPTPASPIIPARDVPRPASEFFDKQAMVTQRPIEPVKNLFTLKTPVEIERHTTSAIPLIPALPGTTVSPIVGVGYVLPETVLARNEIDMNVGPGQMIYRGKATEIPAFPWHRPIPESARMATSKAQDIVIKAPPTEEKDKKVRVGSRGGAKVFIEEPPRVGVEFRTDSGSKISTGLKDVAPDRLVSTQEYLAPSPEMSLEIQHGLGPYAPTVTAPVKIGDNITLVVRSKSQMKVIGACKKAFENPVRLEYQWFEQHNCIKEICTSSRRFSREVSSQNDLRLFDSVKVELDEQYEAQRRAAELDDDICLSKSLSGIVAVLFATVLVAFISSSFLAMSFYLRLSDRTKQTIYAH
ncbi:unnamed protein product [Strongylus vulgaris]|uniref:ZP domain-containing protein n=1 Tax=Strongylus vulgaris TaxID=40348 RepID=A0A3P7JFV6_STRVU|nr:unnamed protein product [Strongylus vulgaris]